MAGKQTQGHATDPKYSIPSTVFPSQFILPLSKTTFYIFSNFQIPSPPNHSDAFFPLFTNKIGVSRIGLSHLYSTIYKLSTSILVHSTFLLLQWINYSHLKLWLIYQLYTWCLSSTKGLYAGVIPPSLCTISFPLSIIFSTAYRHAVLSLMFNKANKPSQSKQIKPKKLRKLDPIYLSSYCLFLFHWLSHQNLLFIFSL